MSESNQNGRKVERGLAEVASALGSHLIDSTVSRSALELELTNAGNGPGLRIAVLDALQAAHIQVVEDVPDIVLVPYETDEPAAYPDAVLPLAPTSPSEAERLREVGRRRLRMDRSTRAAHLSKVLLSAEEEVGLTLLARPDGAMLDAGGYVRLTGESRDAADAMFMHNLGLAHSVAKGYVGQGLEYDDLVQSAMAGLIRAIERFDPFSGYKFSTYATQWLRQSSSRAVANEGRLIRLPVHMWELVRRVMATRQRLVAAGEPATVWHLAKACDLAPEKILECLKLAPGVISLETPLGDDQFTLGDLVDAHVDRPEHVEVHGLFPDDVERLFGDLELREAEVLRMRFALAPYDTVHTLDEIGKVFGVTRERIRQIESKAVMRLRGHLAAEGHAIDVPDKNRRRAALEPDPHASELAATA